MTFVQGDEKDAITDCTEALELKPDYVRCLARRGQLHENTNQPHEAMKDFENVLKHDPGHKEANQAVAVRKQMFIIRLIINNNYVHIFQRLPEKIRIRDEEIKQEMFGNLKKLGNMVLNPFGLSTENFQFVQDPNTGGYSVNFKN